METEIYVQIVGNTKPVEKRSFFREDCLFVKLVSNNTSLFISTGIILYKSYMSKSYALPVHQFQLFRHCFPWQWQQLFELVAL